MSCGCKCPWCRRGDTGMLLRVSKMLRSQPKLSRKSVRQLNRIIRGIRR